MKLFNIKNKKDFITAYVDVNTGTHFFSNKTKIDERKIKKINKLKKKTIPSKK